MKKISLDIYLTIEGVAYMDSNGQGIIMFTSLQGLGGFRVTTHPSDLGGNVANPVGAIPDVLRGSHGAWSQRA